MEQLDLLTCDRCLQGQHRRCRSLRGCPCSICNGGWRKATRYSSNPREATPTPRVKAPRKPRKSGPRGSYGPRMTKKEEDEFCEDILELVKRIAAKVESGQVVYKAPEPDTIECNKCGITKPLAEFYYRKDKGCYRRTCKLCKRGK